MSPENYDDDDDAPIYRERAAWGAPAAAIPVDGDVPDVAPPGEEPPEGPRLSRGGAWLAMGAVALALLLVYLAPGVKPKRTSNQRLTRRRRATSIPPRSMRRSSANPLRCTSR
jgi:hypothetical protein